MIVLLIYTLHLAYDNNGVPVNTSDPIDSLEHRGMLLEALYSALLKGQYLTFTIDGVNNRDMNAVLAELENTRAQQIQLLSNSTTEVSSDDAYYRINHMNRMGSWVDVEVSELNSLLSDPNLTPDAQANYTNSLNAALTYRNFLNSSLAYWNQIEQLQAQTIGRGTTTGGGTTGDTTGGGTTGGTTGGGIESTDTGGGSTVNNINIIESDPVRMSQVALAEHQLMVYAPIASSVSPFRTVDEIVNEVEYLTDELNSENSILDGLPSASASGETNVSGETKGLKSKSKFKVNELEGEISVLNSQREGAAIMENASNNIRSVVYQIADFVTVYGY